MIVCSLQNGIKINVVQIFDHFLSVNFLSPKMINLSDKRDKNYEFHISLD